MKPRNPWGNKNIIGLHKGSFSFDLVHHKTRTFKIIRTNLENPTVKYLKVYFGSLSVMISYIPNRKH